MQLPIHRYRERGTLSAGGKITEDARYLTCSMTNWQLNNANVGSGYSTGTTEQMWDVVTPGFHRRSGKGEVIISDLQQTRRTSSSSASMGSHIKAKTGSACTGFTRYNEYRVNGPFLDYLVKLGYSTPLDGGVPVIGILTDSEVAELMRETSTELLANRGSSKGNLYESLAQANKTSGMIGQLVAQKNSLLTDSKLNKAATLASGYLLMRYGMGPLIKDVDRLLKAQGYEDRQRRLTTRAFGFTDRYSSTSKVVVPGVQTYTLLQQCTDAVNVRAMSLDEVRVGQMYDSGFSAKGLIMTPYELIPYSFVVDWVFNLGDYLSSLIPTPSFVQLGSAIVAERVRQTSFSAVGATSSTYNVLRIADGSCQGVIIDKRRTPGNLGSTLMFKTDFRMTETLRALDAVSLLLSRLDHFKALKLKNLVTKRLSGFIRG